MWAHKGIILLYIKYLKLSTHFELWYFLRIVTSLNFLIICEAIIAWQIRKVPFLYPLEQSCLQQLHENVSSPSLPPLMMIKSWKRQCTLCKKHELTVLPSTLNAFKVYQKFELSMKHQWLNCKLQIVSFLPMEFVFKIFVKLGMKSYTS